MPCLSVLVTFCQPGRSARSCELNQRSHDRRLREFSLSHTHSLSLSLSPAFLIFRIKPNPSTPNANNNISRVRGKCSNGLRPRHETTTTTTMKTAKRFANYNFTFHESSGRISRLLYYRLSDCLRLSCLSVCSPRSRLNKRRRDLFAVVYCTGVDGLKRWD